MSGVDAERTPVIAGVGQAICREELVTTIEMAERAARAALDDAPGLADRIDRVTMVAVSFSPIDTAPATALAGVLGLQAARQRGGRGIALAGMILCLIPMGLTILLYMRLRGWL